MSNIHFFTLADCRNQNPVVFDKAFKECFFEAAKSLPQDILVQALWGNRKSYSLERKAA